MQDPDFVAFAADFPGATPSTGDIAPLLPPCPGHVAAAPLPPSAERRRARHAEISRDEQLVVQALHDALRQIATLGPETPDRVWSRIAETVEANRAARCALNDARINLRGSRYITHADSAPLPASLRWFRHRGNYHGAFRSMAELGNCLRTALGITAGLTPAERTRIARELHLRGEIWTLDHEGAVHVFGRPGSSADLILASERPRLAPSGADSP